MALLGGKVDQDESIYKAIRTDKFGITERGTVYLKENKEQKMKTSELKDELLDYWVFKIKGWKGDVDFFGLVHIQVGHDEYEIYCPSTDWLQGGPIIEQEDIALEPGGEEGKWGAHIWVDASMSWLMMEGETPLIAAMRCYVASKFGDEVPDETNEKEVI